LSCANGFYATFHHSKGVKMPMETWETPKRCVT
jgi:hypothetical protein